MTDTKPETDGNETSSTASASAELERVLGAARAAAAECAASQQSAAKFATEAELARTKATEHLTEVNNKRKEAEADAAKISQIATDSATRSAHIDDGVKYSGEARAEIVASRKAVADLKLEVETATKKARDDAAALTAILGDLTARQTELITLRDQIDALRTAAVAARDTAEKERDETVAFRTAAGKSAEEAATDCKHVHDGKDYIEAQRNAAEEHAKQAKAKFDEATQSATGASDALSTSVTSRSNAETALTEIQAMSEQVSKAKAAAVANQETTAELAKIADSITERVREYEGKLGSFSAGYAEARDKIESLLPRAATAGLAAAFHSQKKKYALPRSWWNAMFFLAIAGLATIGVIEIIRTWSAIPDYEELLRSLIVRVPLVVALIWLALHSGRKSRIANQIQEDYAYKEVVSTSFEGYKKEFASLEEKVAPNSPLAALCTSMVSIIAANPSRVYDKHRDDPTPMSSATEVVKQVTETAKEFKTPPSI